MRIDVTVLYFADCPNWRIALERVHAAAEQANVQVSVSTLAVETQKEADRLGFTGSPTIWVQGVDPFARPGVEPALACRVYPSAHGWYGSPTVDQLVVALTPQTS